MAELSLKERINKYLAGWYEIAPDMWFHKGELSDLGKQAGYSAENVGRRLRELENEGKVSRRLNAKGHAEYQHRELILISAKYPGYYEEPVKQTILL